jgi:hypothetical protein
MGTDSTGRKCTDDGRGSRRARCTTARYQECRRSDRADRRIRNGGRPELVSRSHIGRCESVAVARPGARRTPVCARATWAALGRPEAEYNGVYRPPFRTRRYPVGGATSQERVLRIRTSHICRARRRPNRCPELYSKSQCGRRSRYNLSFSSGSSCSPQASIASARTANAAAIPMAVPIRALLSGL